MYEYDNAYAFVALDKAQDLAGLGAGVTGIEVKTTDRWQAADVGAHLVVALGGGIERRGVGRAHAERPGLVARRADDAGLLG